VAKSISLFDKMLHTVVDTVDPDMVESSLQHAADFGVDLKCGVIFLSRHGVYNLIAASLWVSLSATVTVTS